MSLLLHVLLNNAALATLLCAAAWLIARRSRRSSLCHFLWLLVLLKLICPPLVELPLARWLPAPRGTQAVHVAGASLAATAAAAGPAHPLAAGAVAEMEYVLVLDPAAVPQAAAPRRAEPNPARAEANSDPAPARRAWRLPAAWIGPLGAIWLGGAAFWVCLALGRSYRFSRLLESAAPAGPELQARTAELTARFGLARPPRVVLTAARVSPLLWSMWGRPRIVLPGALVENLPPEQQATLVAHELAHLARGDHRLRWLEAFVLAVHWWNPLAWWARSRMSQAEEECCDALVTVRLPGHSQAYAQALLATVEFLAGSPAGVPAFASGLGTAFPLKRRFEMILANRRTAPWRPLWRRALGWVAVGLLPLSPWGVRAWAEQPSGDAEVVVEAVAVPEIADSAPKSEVTLEFAGELAQAKPQQAVEVKFDLAQAGSAEAGNVVSAHARPAVTLTLAGDSKAESPDKQGASDVGQRIAKLEQSLAALLAELQALKQAHGIRGSEQVHVIQADPTGKVVSRIVKGTPEVVGLGKGPLGVTVREGRVQLDGVQLPQDLPTVQRAVRQYKLKIVDSKSKGEALRKERAALQKRLAEIEAEEQALDAIDADLAAPKPEAK